MQFKKELSILTLFTGLSYLVAYGFNFGIFIYNGLPVELIAIDLNSILVVITVILFPVAFGAYTLTFLHVGRDSARLGVPRSVFNILVIFMSASLAFGSLTSIRKMVDLSIGGLILLGPILFALYLLLLVSSYFVSLFVIRVSTMFRGGKFQLLFAMMAIVSLLMLPALAGLAYAKLSAGRFITPDYKYYYLTENSKGVIAVKCTVDERITFKRMKSEEVEFITETDKVRRSNFKECLKKLRG